MGSDRRVGLVGSVWFRSIDYEDEISDILDVDDETLDSVMIGLSDNDVLPTRPPVTVSVEDRAGLPNGFDVRALTEAGCSPTEAVDYIMIEVHGESQSAWAETRGKDRSTVSGSVSKARKRLQS